jgi:bifunctional non-homologous end joining protein LigD
VKFDGYRIQLHKDRKHAILYSRNGNDLTPRYPTIAQAVAQLPTKAVVLDAELTACSDDGSPDFSALLRKRHTDLCVWVFDILSQFGKDLRPLPLIARRSKLDKLIDRVKNPIIRCSETFSDPLVLLAVCEQRRLEGIVSKRADAPYTSGTTKAWIKVKCPRWREENSWRHEFFERRR